MKEQYIHQKPANPFTVEVVENMKAKTGQILKKFKDLNPTTGLIDPEKREEREAEIFARFKAEVMLAHMKFEANEKCSYSSFVNVCLTSAAKHYVRDAVKGIKHNKKTVSGDAPMFDDEESGSYFDRTPDPTECLLKAMDRFDFIEVYEILRRKNRDLATIFKLTYQGYTLADIVEMYNVPRWKISDKLWPMTIAAVREIYKNLH